MVIVVVQPGRVGGRAGFVAAVELHVGPYGGEGAVEPLDFAVSLRPVRPCRLVRRGAQGGVEHRRAVAGSVVGEHSADDDAVLGEEQFRSPPERGRGLFAVVGSDLRVGQPGVIVDRVVQVAAAAALPSVVAVPCGAAELAVPTAVRDAAELFDVAMNEIAWGAALIAIWPWFAHRQPGALVEVA